MVAQDRRADDGNNFMTEGVSKFNNENYDYRPDIRTKHDKKVSEYVNNHSTDHRIVENLDNYDRMMVNNERSQKQHMAETLNDQYNRDMARLEDKKHKEIEKKKSRGRAKVYGV